MERHAIIVAGGKGLRMDSEIPKQFLRIDGVPIIVLTIQRFLHFDPKLRVVVVIPEKDECLWESIRQEFLLGIPLITTFGGTQRFDSVKNGLNKIDEGLVAIHDAVRPFVEFKTIQTSFESAKKTGSGVAAVDLKDSIREVVKGRNKYVDRSKFKIIQTPQTFRVREIKQAFKIVKDSSFTDDATVFEMGGFEVSLVPGSYSNRKITTVEDLR